MTRRASTWRVGLATRVQRLRVPSAVLARLARVLQSGIAVGLLRREEIGVVVSATYQRDPDFYAPWRYTLRNEEALITALRKHVAARGEEPRLLDLYCGQGREAEIFTRAGYRVTGVDYLSEVIDRARSNAARKGFSAEFIAADIDHWQPTDTAWDVVYTSLWMYSTVPDRAQRVAWVKRIVGWAASDGVAVISVKPPRASSLGLRARYLVARLTAALTRNRRAPEVGDRFDRGLFWHDASRDEVAAELRDAGTELVDSVEVQGDSACVFYIVRGVTNP